MKDSGSKKHLGGGDMGNRTVMGKYNHESALSMASGRGDTAVGGASNAKDAKNLAKPTDKRKKMLS